MLGNPWDAINGALSEAREVRRAVDRHSDSMAGLLVGHLRQVSSETLKDLKRELREFNINTGRWKKR